MRFPHLFEFMDQQWLPASLRDTLREILELACSLPFRPYYRWVADEVMRVARESGCTTVVELGAGPAPITKLMAPDPRSDGLKLIVCDWNPDRAAYEDLEKRYPEKVSPRYDSVDFSISQDWELRTLLFLSGAFHHIPPQDRLRVLQALLACAERGLVFEPLRKSFPSMLFVLGSLVPALLVPLWFLNRAGWLRRLFWCWLVPVGPVLFWWDGWVSCLRMWTDMEWQEALQHFPGKAYTTEVCRSTFCQMVTW